MKCNSSTCKNASKLQDNDPVCSKCLKPFHIGCTSVAATTWNAWGQTLRLGWRCNSCKGTPGRKLSQPDNSQTLIQSSRSTGDSVGSEERQLLIKEISLEVTSQLNIVLEKILSRLDAIELIQRNLDSLQGENVML